MMVRIKNILSNINKETKKTKKQRNKETKKQRNKQMHKNNLLKISNGRPDKNTPSK